MLSRFESDTGTHRTCNNGAIVGWSLSVENNSYISQLNYVTVSSDMIGESIECAHDHNGAMIGSSTLTATGTYMHGCHADL